MKMGNRGLTFVEIILVIVLMGIAIPALVGAVSFITQSQVNPMGTTVATALAQEQVEATMAQKQSTCAGCGYANVPPANCAVPLVGVFNPVAGYTNYQIKVDAECVNSGLATVFTDQGYKKVTVTVRAVGVGPNIPDAVLVSVLTNY